MTNTRRRAAALILALTLVFACAGCMSANVEDLYSLPQMSEEYVQLQELVGQVIAAGGSYAAPTGGSNRQTIQLRDLDGDGTPEALAFLADENHTPMVCVYRQDAHGDYYHYIVLPGDGTAVAGVDYADLNGDGVMSVADVVLLRRAILSSAGVDVYPMGDMNDDNQLTVADVVLLRRAVLNQ